jgi:4-hydroxy-2-oxoheptanedioate aldolase
VAVPGVDGVYIGPNDLALGTGHGRGTYRDTPEVDALIQRIIDACRSAGIAAGVHCSDVEMARHWAGRGATMLTGANDSALLKVAADAAIRALRAQP